MDEAERQRSHPDYTYRGPVARTHEQTVEKGIRWIVVGVWIIAVAVIANVLSGIFIAVAAASH